MQILAANDQKCPRNIFSPHNYSDQKLGKIKCQEIWEIQFVKKMAVIHVENE